VQDECELRRLLPTVVNPMLQQLAGPIEAGLGHEYTCSIFQCADGRLLGPFVSRRTLRGGSSWIVEVAPVVAIEPLMRQLGALVPSVGSLNVQLMLTNGRAVPFEFNARFSGTTPIRAYYGFNEPEMALRSYVLGEPVAEPTIRRGLAVRYIEEIFLDDVNVDTISQELPKGRIENWF
jgi:carbamoyl-phosphate synthase large subunit